MDIFKNASNLTTIKLNNRSLILRVLNSVGQSSRADLARITGLTKMAITNIINDLMAEGMIYETGTFDSSNGRKPIMLNLAKNACYACGLYISRDFAHANIANLKGEIIVESTHYFEQVETERSFLEILCKCVEKVLTESKAAPSNIVGIGIASIGPLDQDHGIILDPPNFRGLRKLPVVPALRDYFNLQTFLENDMNACAIAEKLFGNAKSVSDFVYVGVTNGIGSGIIINSSLFRGHNGFAGEIGHTTIDMNGGKCPCGNLGCLELYASIPNTVQLVKNSISLGAKSSLPYSYSISWKDIVAAAQAEDALCVKALDKLAYYLSVGLINTINTFDPEVIFLGHDIALAGEMITKPLNEMINGRLIFRNAKQVRVELSAFGDYTPCIGAPSIVLEKFFNGEIQGRL